MKHNDMMQPPTGAGHDQKPDYESKGQLAARISVSTRTIDNLMTVGLPYCKLTGKLVRFPRTAVDQWLADRQVRRA
jgi:excisionase family DNA binding protein